MADTYTILLIDDDGLDRRAVRRALREGGVMATLVEAPDRAAALAALADRTFDCILLDYLLPGADGLAVLREIRARGIATPILMMTGQGDEQLAVDIMKAGATDYLIKGALSPERLAQSIRSAVRVGQAERQAALAEQALRESVQQLQFLAEASRLLASSLEEQAILDTLARLAVPTLADWCAVDLVEPSGALRRAVSQAREGADPAWIEAAMARWPLMPAAPHGTPATVRSGEPMIYPPLVDTPHGDEAATGWVLAPGVTGALAVPLMVRGRALGALALVSGPSGRRYGPSDLMLAAELARRAAVALENAELYREAREAIRIRDEFLSIASHEFRTPLTGLLGHAQLLQRRMSRSSTLAERDARALQTIVEQASRLNRMITALLDVSRLQTGQFTIERRPLDLNDLVRRLAEEVRPTLDRHELRVTAGPTPARVLGDELRLHEVLQNLVHNALKYSPNGGEVEIVVGQSNGWAWMTVRDQGIGIPAEALPNLFRRFYRAPNAQDQQIGGIGLGLYVVNELVSLHGGVIEVESEVGKGSAFTVRLPAAPPDA
jgi:signal transduction histidine kinase/DNA-binding response OmpR family regulator